MLQAQASWPCWSGRYSQGICFHSVLKCYISTSQQGHQANHSILQLLHPFSARVRTASWTTPVILTPPGQHTLLQCREMQRDAPRCPSCSHRRAQHQRQQAAAHLCLTLMCPLGRQILQLEGSSRQKRLHMHTSFLDMILVPCYLSNRSTEKYLRHSGLEAVICQHCTLLWKKG